MKSNLQIKKLRQLRALERARDLVVVNLHFGYPEAASVAMRELRRVSMRLERHAVTQMHIWHGVN